MTDFQRSPSKPSAAAADDVSTSSAVSPVPPRTLVTPVAATTASATADSAATVTVKSTPDGADISVDGKFVGNTPSTLKLAPGDHTISIESLGFKNWQRTTTLSLPEDLEAADVNLNNAVCYELIASGNYVMARKLLDFALDTLKKHSDENMRRTFVINRAQVYKCLGMNDECLRILNQEDWSASSDKLKLGVAVLSEDFNKASELMPRLAETSDFAESFYKEWPLFRDFRKSSEFLAAYQKVYHRAFTVEEVSQAVDMGAAESAEVVPPAEGSA